MQEQNVSVSQLETDLSTLEVQGKTVMTLAVSGQSVGLIAVMDTVKESAAEAVNQLKGMNLEIVMLTGDNERTANAIASQLGIKKVIANVLPWEKSDVIRKLQGEGKIVAWLATELMMRQRWLKPTLALQ